MTEHSGAGARRSTKGESHVPPLRRLRFIIPAVLLMLIAALLAWQLLTGDPDRVPSALIDKSIPEFDLPPIKGYDEGLSSEDIRDAGISLVNVFASWCGPCRVEHPLLMALTEQEVVPIFGLNYKDEPDDASSWLKRLGNPYERIGADTDGRVGIEWGVYGVPETFVIDDEGRIVYKHIGVLTEPDLFETILPLIESLAE